MTRLYFLLLPKDSSQFLPLQHLEIVAFVLQIVVHLFLLVPFYNPNPQKLLYENLCYPQRHPTKQNDFHHMTRLYFLLLPKDSSQFLPLQD
jgi:hypothetical protein